VSRLLGSVRARATLAATLVVAVALVAAGTAVLLSLRSNLLGEAGTQAERSAREVAAELSVGTPYRDLSLDVDDRPVQVVDEDGRLVAASEDLERISGTGVAVAAGTTRTTTPATPSNPARSASGPPSATGRRRSTATRRTTGSPPYPSKPGTRAGSPSTPVPRCPPSTAPSTPR
jgi:hypothetical protein